MVTNLGLEWSGVALYSLHYYFLHSHVYDSPAPFSTYYLVMELRYSTLHRSQRAHELNTAILKGNLFDFELKA